MGKICKYKFEYFNGPGDLFYNLGSIVNYASKMHPFKDYLVICGS